MPPFLISPSDLTFLWDECPRCFYLKVRHNLARPRMPFPSVFNKYHRLLQRYFEGRDCRAVQDSLPGGKMMHEEMHVQSAPLSLTPDGARFIFSGRVDNLIRFDDGSWGIVDYKMTEPAARYVPFYSRQLHAYAWALERAGVGERLAPVTRMGLLCLDPEELMRFEPDSHALVRLTPRWIEIPRDDAAYRTFLLDVLDLLAADHIPQAGRNCGACRYYDVMSGFWNEAALPVG